MPAFFPLLPGLLTRIARGLASRPVFQRIVEGLDSRSDNRMGELGMLAQAFEFKRINGVSGDYFEFGLWRGKTFCFAHRMKHRYRFPDMKLFGFDSFEGLPEIQGEHQGMWSQGQFACSEPEFRAILRRHRFQDSEFELVRGFYGESLNDELHTRLHGRTAAICYIDCDLYTSTREVLSFLSRYVVEGSVVCFDDYWAYRGNPDKGGQRALREFLADNADISFIPWLDYAPLGKSFIVGAAVAP